MSLKTILVHVDDGDRCAHRVQVAIRLALDARAHLIGIYLVPAPELPPSVAALLPTDVVERRQREIGEAQHAAEHRFRNAAGRAELTRIEWRAPAGPPIAAAVEHGRCADLFVMGQRDQDDSVLPFANDLIATTLLSAGRPLLIVPYVGAPATPAENVLIAWDCGREASRAVADALPLLARAKQVHVVTYHAGEGADTDIALSTSRLRGWLHDHAIEARVDRVQEWEGGVGELLLSQAADWGCDLIVMGGYGHARLRQFVLGGATRTMLARMTVPVLMSH